MKHARRFTDDQVLQRRVLRLRRQDKVKVERQLVAKLLALWSRSAARRVAVRAVRIDAVEKQRKIRRHRLGEIFRQ
jgi:hypothetical protein